MSELKKEKTSEEDKNPKSRRILTFYTELNAMEVKNSIESNENLWKIKRNDDKIANKDGKHNKN